MTERKHSTITQSPSSKECPSGPFIIRSVRSDLVTYFLFGPVRFIHYVFALMICPFFSGWIGLFELSVYSSPRLSISRRMSAVLSSKASISLIAASILSVNPPTCWQNLEIVLLVQCSPLYLASLRPQRASEAIGERN